MRAKKSHFPNRDRIYHNVFSVSPVKSFDLGQYKSHRRRQSSERFERPGLVPVYCNIHPHMIAYVVVLENAAYALAAPDGSFTIRGFRRADTACTPGRPGAEPVRHELELAAGVRATADFELIGGAPPSHKRKDGSEYPPPGSEAERSAASERCAQRRVLGEALRGRAESNSGLTAAPWLSATGKQVMRGQARRSRSRAAASRRSCSSRSRR